MRVSGPPSSGDELDENGAPKDWLDRVNVFIPADSENQPPSPIGKGQAEYRESRAIWAHQRDIREAKIPCDLECCRDD